MRRCGLGDARAREALARRGRRDSRGLPHLSLEPVPDRRGARGRLGAGARRGQRHRHRGDPAAAEAGVRVIVTAGSAEKCARCLELGADAALDYSKGEFAPAVLENDRRRGRRRGARLDRRAVPRRSTCTCSRIGGRLVLIGLMGGAKAEIDLGLRRRASASRSSARRCARGPSRRRPRSCAASRALRRRARRAGCARSSTPCCRSPTPRKRTT